MNRLIYFRLEIKRFFKLLPHIIIGTIALALVVGVIVACASKITSSKRTISENKQIAFSSQDNSDLTKIVVSTLSQSKSITNVCSIIETNYEEALELVKDENTVSSIIIPKDFMNSLMNGTNYSISIYFSSTRSIFTLIITELSKAAQTTLQAAQAGVYTLHDYYYDNNAGEYESAANERLNTIYLMRAFSRENFFKKHKLLATGHISINNYYFASAIMLILLLLGCLFILKTKDTDQIIFIKLTQNGIGCIFQMLTHIISIFIVLYLIFIMVMGLIFELNKYVGLGFNINPSHIFIDGIILTLCCSSIICMISNVFTNKYSAILLHFMFVLTSSFISGAFIPSVFLPDSLRSIAIYLPTTYIFKSIVNILSGEFAIGNMFNLIQITIVSLIIGTLIKSA